jgi:hypothetical protein
MPMLQNQHDGQNTRTAAALNSGAMSSHCAKMFIFRNAEFMK